MWFKLTSANFTNNLGTLSQLSNSFRVSTKLTNYSANSSISSVAKNGSYSNTFTPVGEVTSNYTYSVTMGGVTVSSGVSLNSDTGVLTVSISPVTDNIVITASCTATSAEAPTPPITDVPSEPVGVKNLWTITDSSALFKDGHYRMANGSAYETTQFDATYPSTDKIYLGDYQGTGTYSLDLWPGKTYRWQYIPEIEFGSITLGAPWYNVQSPDTLQHQRFWFYDASDTVIANDSASSSDGGNYLMTIPSNAVYMRFMGYYSREDSQYINQLGCHYHDRLMITEGEEEQGSYIAPNV